MEEIVHAVDLSLPGLPDSSADAVAPDGVVQARIENLIDVELTVELSSEVIVGGEKHAFVAAPESLAVGEVLVRGVPVSPSNQGTLEGLEHPAAVRIVVTAFHEGEQIAKRSLTGLFAYHHADLGIIVFDAEGSKQRHNSGDLSDKHDFSEIADDARPEPVGHAIQTLTDERW